MHDLTETAGMRLRRVRGKMSQAEFAAKIGVHKDLVGKYERDINLPGGDILKRINDVFDVDLTWLLTGAQPAAIQNQKNTGDETLAPLGVRFIPGLYGKVLEAVSTIYREFGFTVTLAQVGEEAAQIAADLQDQGLTQEEVPGAIKGATAALRRQLTEARFNPLGDAATKRQG